VLAVVKHKQQVGVAQSGDERLVDGRLGLLAHVKQPGDRPRNQCWLADRGEVAEDNAVRAIGQHPRCRLDPKPRLPDAAYAGEGHQARLCEQPRHRRQLRLATDEARQRRGEVVPLLGRRRGRRHLLAQDRPLEFPQLLARLKAKLLDQQRARPPVGGQRLRLPPRAVEREDQVLPQPLAVRVLLDQRRKLLDERVGPAQRQLGFDPLFEREQPQRLEPLGFQAEGALAGEARQRSTAPERQRLPEPVGRPLRGAAGERVLALPHQLLEPVDVNRLARDPQRVRGATT
jgi:hypothetical protein